MMITTTSGLNLSQCLQVILKVVQWYFKSQAKDQFDLHPSKQPCSCRDLVMPGEGAVAQLD